MGLLLLAILMLLPLVAGASVSEAAFTRQQEQRYVCDGDPLVALVDNGAVDATDIANTADGTVPGAFVVLRWRDLSLQLPRTNNAGAPSYTDGIWWWSVEDPDHPLLRLRRGGIKEFACSLEA